MIRRLLFCLFFVSACHRNTVIGSLNCNISTDCSPPIYVCSADRQCVDGCIDDDDCLNGTTCDTPNGECTGDGLGSSCADDSACAPPDSVCRASTNSCVPGCTLGSACGESFTCNPTTGHCCDPFGLDCPQPQADAGASCNTDSECPSAPMLICSAGACVASCMSGAPCTAPLTCESTGHCGTPDCARDADCDSGSYCTQAGVCTVLSFGGAIPCAGGKKLSYQCAGKSSVADFSSCAGTAGPAGCPYCLDYSCLHPGTCASNNDCHAGDSCTSGLCQVNQPACPIVASVADVLSGVYAAGKEICVRGMVTVVRSGYDGVIDVGLGSSPELFTNVLRMYQTAGVTVPTVGQTVTVHGTVRWNGAHADRELLPVDWIGP